jgi:hypothetical protein
MKPRMDNLRECCDFLKDPTVQEPEIFNSLEIKEIRLLLQAAAETIVPDNSAGRNALTQLLIIINNRYPLNKYEEPPEQGDERFRKSSPEQWQQVLDDQS